MLLFKYVFNQETNIKYQDIINSIEKDYNLSFEVDPEVKKQFESLISNSQNEANPNLLYESININSEELIKIGKLLNLSDLDFKLFVENVTNFNNDANKVLFFYMQAELARIEKRKEVLDKRVQFRLNILLLSLTLILLAQTILFYHLIYNVEELGWDLVEPSTFLFGSIIFLLGLFTYFKLGKSVYSADKIFSDFKKTLIQKQYFKHNIDNSRYVKLRSDIEKLKLEIRH